MATNSIKSSWQAVSVVPGDACCAAVQELRGQRFLARTAPRLPLPACTSQDRCQCKYQRYSDRRAAPRRAADEGAASTPAPPSGEQRRPGERRERRR